MRDIQTLAVIFALSEIFLAVSLLLGYELHFL